MAQLSSIPPIAEFPAGKWKLQWLGRINRNDNVQTEPTIEVSLQSLDDKDEVIINRNIGVGQLPLLTIGSVWENSVKTNDAFGRVVTLSNILINDRQTKIFNIRKSLSDTEMKFIIPRSEWPVLSSNCVALEYNNDPYGIIIPCAEIARFYYCRSTDLSLAAFNGAYKLDLNKIINPAETTLDSNPPSIHLRKWFANNDAWVIGRILLSPIAKQGVNYIHNSIQAYRSNSNQQNTETPAPFKCNFPFVGTTTLKARVHETKAPDGSVRYVVLELIQCSGAFPYSDLEVGRDNPGSGDKSADDLDPESDGTEKPHWMRQGKPKALNIPLQSQQETNKSMCSVDLPIEDLNPFTFLLNKTLKIKDQNTTPSTHKTKKDLGKEIVVTKRGTGEGKHGKSDTQRTPITRVEGFGADLDLITKVIALIQAKDDYGASLRWSGKMDVTLAKAPNSRQWGYLDSDIRQKRQFVVIDIVHVEKHYSFVDVERRRDSNNQDKEKISAAILYRKDGMRVTDDELLQVMQNFVRLKGCWKSERTNPETLVKKKETAYGGTNVHCKQLKHTWGDDAKKLCDKLASHQLNL